MLRSRDRREQFADHGLPPQGGRVQPAGAVPGSAGLLRAGLEDRTKDAGLMMGSATVRSLCSASRRTVGGADSTHRLARRGECCQLVGETPTRAVETTALPNRMEALPLVLQLRCAEFLLPGSGPLRAPASSSAFWLQANRD